MRRKDVEVLAVEAGAALDDGGYFNSRYVLLAGEKGVMVGRFDNLTQVVEQIEEKQRAGTWGTTPRRKEMMRYHEKLETHERPKYRSFAVVMGTGEFPYDMLRYDSCHPWRETDSSAMRNDLFDPQAEISAGQETRWVVVVREHVDSAPRWTPGRWKSMGWTLVESTPEEIRDFDRERQNAISTGKDPRYPDRFSVSRMASSR